MKHIAEQFEFDNMKTKVPIKGGLRRIGDIPKICCHPEHNPPGHMVYEPGVYEYTCPGCGKITSFTVNPPTLGSSLIYRTSKSLLQEIGMLLKG